jgi:hypothetical protein
MTIEAIAVTKPQSEPVRVLWVTDPQRYKCTLKDAIDDPVNWMASPPIPMTPSLQGLGDVQQLAVMQSKKRKNNMVYIDKQVRFTRSASLFPK